MQPSSKPRDGPAAPSAAHPLAALGMLALVATAPMMAMMMFRSETIGGFGGPGVPVWYDADLNSKDAYATACIEPDYSFWGFDYGDDEDGDFSVWAPAGPNESDGSNKANASCVSAPPDSVGVGGSY